MAKKTKTKKRITNGERPVRPRGVLNIPAGFRPDGSILKNGGKKK